MRNSSNHFRITTLLIVFSSLLIGTSVIFGNSFALPSENNKNQLLTDNLYPSTFGILEYSDVSNSDSSSPCMSIYPNYLVKSVDSANFSLLDLDGFHHNYFAVIGNYDDASYQYLQIKLPSGSGDPSYLIDLKNQDKIMHGGLYTGYENLAVLAETASSDLSLPEHDYQRFFANGTKDVTHSLNSLKPDDYSFDAILFKFEGSPWAVKDKLCVIRAEWPFTVTEQGDAITAEPRITIGTFTDVTETFPPLKQSKFGMIPESIRCKSDLQVVLKQYDDDDSGNDYNRVACVSPDTKSKLIERGWATPLRQNDPDCSTDWIVTLASDVDKDALKSTLLNEIAQFGDEYDLSDREVTVDIFDGGNEALIRVQGCWQWPGLGEPDLQNMIRNLPEISDIKK